MQNCRAGVNFVNNAHARQKTVTYSRHSRYAQFVFGLGRQAVPGEMRNEPRQLPHAGALLFGGRRAGQTPDGLVVAAVNHAAENVTMSANIAVSGRRSKAHSFGSTKEMEEQMVRLFLVCMVAVAVLFPTPTFATRLALLCRRGAVLL